MSFQFGDTKEFDFGIDGVPEMGSTTKLFADIPEPETETPTKEKESTAQRKKRKMEEMKKEIEDLKKERDGLKEKLDRVVTTEDNLERTRFLDKRSAKLTEQIEEFNEVRRKQKELQAARPSLQAQVEELQAHLERFMRSKAETPPAKDHLSPQTGLRSLEAETDSMRDAMETLKAQNASFQDTVGSLEARIVSLQVDLQTANDEIERVNNAWREEIKAVTAATKRANDAEEALREAKIKLEEKATEIEIFEVVVTQQNETEEEQLALIQSLQTKLVDARKEKVNETDKTELVREELGRASADNKGINEMLRTYQTKFQLSETKLENLEKDHHRLTMELDEARDKNAALEYQIDRLKSDNKERAFDPLPGAYVSPDPEIDSGPHQGGRRPTLEEELELTGLSGEPSGDENGTEDGNGGDNLKESLKPLMEDEKKENGQSSSSEPHEEAATKATLEIRYTPFAISSHNPILCWLFVELNFFILFSAWVSKLPNKVAAHTLRYGGKSNSVNPTPAEAGSSTTHDSQASAPAASEASGDARAPLRPLDVPAQESTTLEARIVDAGQGLIPLPDSPGKGETIPGIERDHQSPTLPMIMPNTKTSPSVRAWYSIITSPTPSDMPPIKETLYGMLFHLFIYACIGIGIMAYRERQLWLAANDSTRIFLLELLDHPPRDRGGLTWLLFALPENWKHGVEVFIWKAIIENFNLQVNYPMPG